MWHGVKQVENKLCQDTANNTSVASLQLSYGLASECYCFCVSPFLPVILNLLPLLRWCPPVPGENKAEDWTRHLYLDALMESLRLKWQGVKGESTENSRAPHCHAAVALPNHSTVMLWEVCVFQCSGVCVYEEGEGEVNEWEVSCVRMVTKDFKEQLFLFTGFLFVLAMPCCKMLLMFFWE